MNITESRPVSISEANDLLAKRAKDTELEYEQEQAAEHADKFTKLKLKDIEKLVKSIMEKYEKVDLELAQKIADIAPKRPETLKAILMRKRVDLSDEEVEDLLKMIKK
jgi:DNA-directed RNA polymerase subunit F